MSEFHNPYHFVPFSELPGPGTFPRATGDWPAHITHDRFVAGTVVDGKEEACFSGRLILKLTVEEETVVGGDQTPGNKHGARRVQAFKLPDGKLAIPSTSLRGMISQVLESATNSTFRVLQETVTSGKFTMVRDLCAFFRDPDGSGEEEGSHLIPLRVSDGRRVLTMAEGLFGFVEDAVESKEGGDESRQSLALASRVRFSTGLSSNATTGSSGISKIMDSPKAKYPSIYYNRRDRPEGSFIRKEPGQPDPWQLTAKGRKFYLHREELRREDWETVDKRDRLEQKSSFTPLRKGSEFWFHVDFHNLSRLELEALCFSLRPAEAFRHKIGAGKPLGLGKVRIDPAAVLLVDRKQRYLQDDLASSRWHMGWEDEELLCESPYPAGAVPSSSPEHEPATLARDYTNRIAGPGASAPHLRDTLHALLLMGDPAALTGAPVHYPQVAGESNLEGNLYKWFQKNNDEGQGQYLHALRSGVKELPTLDRRTQSEPPPLIGEAAELAAPVAVKADNNVLRDHVFFLGGQDLEMATIRSLLQTSSATLFCKSLSWNEARVSAYAEEIAATLAEGRKPVLVELENDLDAGIDADSCLWIDHHGDQAGKNQPGSLRQVFELLGCQEADWSHDFEAVQINDIEGAAGLQKLLGDEARVLEFKRRDFAAQGVDEAAWEDIVAATGSVTDTTKIFASGTVLLLLNGTDHASAAAELTRIKEPSWTNVVVESPNEINFFGKGAVVEKLQEHFAEDASLKSFSGGAFPDQGFWGAQCPAERKAELLEIIGDTIRKVRKEERARKNPWD